MACEAKPKVKAKNAREKEAKGMKRPAAATVDAGAPPAPDAATEEEANGMKRPAPDAGDQVDWEARSLLVCSLLLAILSLYIFKVTTYYVLYSCDLLVSFCDPVLLVCDQ